MNYLPTHFAKSSIFIVVILHTSITWVSFIFNKYFSIINLTMDKFSNCLNLASNFKFIISFGNCPTLFVEKQFSISSHFTTYFFSSFEGSMSFFNHIGLFSTIALILLVNFSSILICFKVLPFFFLWPFLILIFQYL